MVDMPAQMLKSDVFDRWINGLRDARARGEDRGARPAPDFGNPGDVKPVGHGVSEMRIDYGPGYRVYFTRRGPLVIVLLCGGDKSRQQRDIV